MQEEIFLLGIGRNTPVFIDLVEQSGYKVVGLYHYNDSRTGEIDHGFEILGSFNDLFLKGNLKDLKFLLTMGDNEIRGEISNKIIELGGILPTIIHPTAVISRFAKIGTGVVISPFTYIQANSHIGDNTIVLSGVNISHNNIIGKNCFIAGGVTIGAYTTIGANVFIGQGVLTISDKVKKIEDNAFIGAGSLVTKSVEKNKKIYGRPAK
ncbi:DapH/DapD/GlmU-related protein [Empedobacter stercoris]|uniref:Transferase n=1 Tax=Empedobacter stercoris TaxID=1628248 RepID=A0ABX1WM54_9FLAO|nr:DapH/DapD/GlmU-related protein [Empedobacter stercoris]NOJ75675.1 transferase [Empedobacter stercoris]